MGKLEQFLIELGIMPSYKGFRYTIEAVNYIKNNNCLKFTAEEIYDYVGKKFEDPVNNVRRAIRYAVEIADKEVLKKIGFKTSPSSKKFLFMLAVL